ncbi:MAG: hypothetical protein IKP12_02645 [Acholeplasmatales bacterium]|nr:hypothetical protein [Acholeplasmatales bacterium]
MMDEYILFDKKEKDVKKEINKRKIKRLIAPEIHVLWVIAFSICHSVKYIFDKIYISLYPKKSRINKYTKIAILIYSIVAIGYNAYLYFNKEALKYIYLIMIPVIAILYLIIKLLLYIYYVLIGNYQLLDKEMYDTETFITTKLDKIIKFFGHTGAGKDTIVAGCSSVLVRSFEQKTFMDLNKIKDICYIFDFDLLDNDLSINYKGFMSFSKELIEANFIKMASMRNYYVKKYYIKHNKLKDDVIYKDYLNFKNDVLSYDTKYCYGVGVNRKHFLQMIIEEYIEWFIRLNYEHNFLLTNQPFVESYDKGLMAKEFSFNFIRIKGQDKEDYDKQTRKKIITNENVFFPWKDRLVVAETECGSWYMNKESETISEILKSGCRDFKAYQRHFMKDFYWFSVDQAPDRTAKLFRELDHSYIGVLNREEYEGGMKRNFFLGFLLKYYQFRLNLIDRKAYRNESRRNRLELKLEDYKNLYFSSKKSKYKKVIDIINKKLSRKIDLSKHEYFKSKISMVNNKIDLNKKDGYIVVTACVSKTASLPSDYKVLKMDEVLYGDKNYISYVTRFVFKTMDCERYDTRYMRNLAEDRAQKTLINYANIPLWDNNMKMTKKDIKWLGYLAIKDMFDIKDEEINNIRYGDGYKEHIREMD